LIFGPSAPSRAGSRVIAASTATTTETADEMPMLVTSGMPATESEQSAMTTVPPAKNTAPPAVAVARAVDSSISMSSLSWSLWRVTTNSA
jgi:hypothetical protein